ncbi:hypothetical protein [Hydrogenophaga sp. RWCD_12]|uniref:hypothetical protein n=1 Tax=Hydrogenophaga sp. RWCD_12 TaxID=3391190 RepID=UPI003984DE22
MNRGALVGGVLGVVVLAFLGGYWLANPAPNSATSADASRSAAGAPSAAPGGLTPPSNTTRGADGTSVAAGTPRAPWMNPPAAGAADPAASAGAAPVTEMSREERRKVREQVRKKLADLQAKGPNVTIAEVQSLMDEVEVLGRGVFDPRYFQTMRQMLEQSARVQALGKELQVVAASSAPKDVARRQQILAEMRNLSDQISQGSAALQSYANATLAKPVKQP